MHIAPSTTYRGSTPPSRLSREITYVIYSIGQQPGIASFFFLSLCPAPGEGKGDDSDEQATTKMEVGLHFVKLRPEPVTADNMRNLVQVSCHQTHNF